MSDDSRSENDETIEQNVAAYSLPVRRRLNALRKLHIEFNEIHAKYEREALALQTKYHELYQPLYKKRSEIVMGAVEPSDEDCKPSAGCFDYVGLQDIPRDGYCPADSGAAVMACPADPNDKGVPKFWFDCVLNNGFIRSFISENDLPVLEKLVDIQLSWITSNKEKPTYQLDFEFAPNDYFTNKVLTKKFIQVDSEYGYSPESSVGCVISWKMGKDLTVTKKSQTQTHKSRNQMRTIERVLPAKTFFNFFKDVSIPDSIDPDSGAAEKLNGALEDDFALGEEFRDAIIPEALLWFTGEAIDGDDNSEFDDDDDDESDDGVY